MNLWQVNGSQLARHPFWTPARIEAAASRICAAVSSCLFFRIPKIRNYVLRISHPTWSIVTTGLLLECYLWYKPGMARFVSLSFRNSYQLIDLHLIHAISVACIMSICLRLLTSICSTFILCPINQLHFIL